MWRNVGIMRRGERLQATLDSLDFWTHYTMDKLFDSSDGWEIQNQLTIARLVAMCALERTESVGVHYRDDGAQSPPPDPYEVVIDGDRDSLCVSRRLLVDTQS